VAAEAVGEAEGVAEVGVEEVGVVMAQRRHRSSEHSSPASSQGSSHILRWRPILGTCHCCRNTNLASVVEGAAEGAAEAEALESVPESVLASAVEGAEVGVVRKSHSSVDTSAA